MHISANNPASASQKLDRLRHAFLAILAYLIDMSKIGCGTIPCSLLKLHILRSFLQICAGQASLQSARNPYLLHADLTTHAGLMPTGNSDGFKIVLYQP
ncbi:MAG: hypothetical protein CSA45_06240 [Gammaproteobacteria bacterium]|nr:MAG: hypothetical protein CSA45_06240 [Gammaproteobacteria bacterium]